MNTIILLGGAALAYMLFSSKSKAADKAAQPPGPGPSPPPYQPPATTPAGWVPPAQGGPPPAQPPAQPPPTPYAPPTEEEIIDNLDHMTEEERQQYLDELNNPGPPEGIDDLEAEYEKLKGGY